MEEIRPLVQLQVPGAISAGWSPGRRLVQFHCALAKQRDELEMVSIPPVSLFRFA